MYREYKGLLRGRVKPYGRLSPSLQPGVRLYAAPLLGSTGPMDEKGCFRFKGAGGRRTSRGYAVRGGGTAGDVAASIELCGEVSHACWGGALVGRSGGGSVGRPTPCR
jgi:hypothetical protein